MNTTYYAWWILSYRMCAVFEPHRLEGKVTRGLGRRGNQYEPAIEDCPED
jgi:hypothetical protein